MLWVRKGCALQALCEPLESLRHCTGGSGASIVPYHALPVAGILASDAKSWGPILDCGIFTIPLGVHTPLP